MSVELRALVYGLAVLAFAIAFIISLEPPAKGRQVNWIALGLALAFLVPFVIEARAAM